MFLPVNMCKFCKYIFNSYCKLVYLEAVIQGFSLKWLFYIYLGNSRGGVHFQWSCRSAVLVGVGSFVGVSQLFYLPIVWTTVFWGIALSDCFIILSTLFIFNLHGRKALWRALLVGGFLINIWYCISFLLNINSALVIYRAFLHRWLIYWGNAFINFQLF